MTGKLRLEDLRVVTKFGATRPDGVTANRVPFDLTPATVADWVEVGRQLGAEIVESAGVTFVDMPDGHDGLILAVECRSWDVTPNTYLLFRLPVESPTPKEGEQ